MEDRGGCNEDCWLRGGQGESSLPHSEKEVHVVEGLFRSPLDILIDYALIIKSIIRTFTTFNWLTGSPVPSPTPQRKSSRNLCPS